MAEGLNPIDISKLITEDININNGIILENQDKEIQDKETELLLIYDQKEQAAREVFERSLIEPKAALQLAKEAAEKIYNDTTKAAWEEYKITKARLTLYR